MSREWEETFSSWAQAPGKTENERIERTVNSIRNALNADDFLSSRSKVYAQGSYRNRVNVRQDSDVDIGILYTGNTFYPDYPEGMSKSDVGNIDGDYTYPEFKDRVETALVEYYGRGAVKRGKKAFDLHENTYRVDADVVPVFEHRRYSQDGSYICGVQLFPDDGGKIINWPERLYDDKHWPNQHYENAVSKNTNTGRRYKGTVRVLKKLRNTMDEKGISAAKPVSGFLIECLVWNTPNNKFVGDYWEDDVRSCITHLWSNTKKFEDCNEWGEVSEFKYLFRGSPDTKRQQAHAFIDSAWDFIGVKS
ncbi:nucleotidyltransferase domain-containing protein [Porticoccus hydrocarbonoclasticus]|uniref:nucleotidyltransferase domain-containing protein n=1 Tax=Porticoccus hydrocarbonoclasticus TaxID=1073414 RepID=UPI0023520088|nr:nucleotidyltransferase [Porticoccus hydrocarbonoclasticus]|tara:strand:- start:8746 stop:9666 length:921 start_codon:yes stop_codon:yes gene_type:complete